MVVIHMMRMVQYKYSTDFKFSFFGRKNKGFSIMVTFPVIILFFEKKDENFAILNY